MNEITKHLKNFIDFEKEHHPKFGFGDPDVEKKQKKINVFMVAGSLTSKITGEERRRKVVDANITLKDVKKIFGRKEPYIADENGFMFAEEDLDRPLWNFSNGGRVMIKFVNEPWNVSAMKTFVNSKM